MFDGPHSLELDPQERRARLRLARGARIGPVTFHEALAHFGSARAACVRLATCSDADIDREEAGLARAGGQFLVVGDPAYPAALTAVAGAPPVLSAIGDLTLLARPTLALVGARDASLAGRRFAAELAATLGARDLSLRRDWPAASMLPRMKRRWPPAPWPSWRAASTRSTRRRMPPCTARLPRGV